MKNKKIQIGTLIFLILFSCGNQVNKGSEKTTEQNIPSAVAIYETPPMPHNSSSDCADDPAIWVNHQNPAESKIIGTDKLGGLAVYNLKGEELFYYPFGSMNNVDLRYDFVLGTDTIDIICASNTSSRGISIYKISDDGSLEDIASKPIQSQMAGNVYGFCMYKSPLTGIFYAFVNSMNGEVEQWQLIPETKSISAKLVRTFKLNTSIEGMVADDENQTLFISEETKGIWKFGAEPDNRDEGFRFEQNANGTRNRMYDQEGLSIYYLPDKEGYIISSSQGDNTFNVFERNAPYAYIGNFSIADGIVDGAEETDGVAIYSYSLNEDFKHGLVVVMDGYNYNDNELVAQNFKLVPWENIAQLFYEPLGKN